MMNTNTIKIGRIIYGGCGPSRLENGQIILIKGCLPNETVSCVITEKKKNYLVGTTKEVVTRHPDRREPLCQYYGKCGGCDMQHATYETQLTLKDLIVGDLLQRNLPHISSDSYNLNKIVPAPDEFGYRQRIRLHLDTTNRPGFLHVRSNTIIPIETCLLAQPAINIAFQALLNHPISGSITSHCQELELLYHPYTEKVVCIFHLTRPPRPTDKKNVRRLLSDVDILEKAFFWGKSLPLSEPITQEGAEEGKGLYMPVEQPGKGQRLTTWEVGGFCQVNLKQNTQLVHMVEKLSAIVPEETVLDLFCGMGNFSIPLAQKASSLMGIEGQGSAIRSAKKNSAHLNNCSFKKSPIHTSCQELIKENRTFDCVVIDPPRAGVPGMVTDLARLASKKLIYISCDPATLCRDLKDLTNCGFIIKTIQPIDMFPQTHHTEIVVKLEKN